MRSWTLLPAVLLAACEATAPTRPLIGQWAAQGAGLVANRRQVQIHIACWWDVLDRPVVLDASGDFALPEAPLGDGVSTIAVRGHVAGDQLTLYETMTTPQGTRAFTLVLARNRPDVNDAFCANP